MEGSAPSKYRNNTVRLHKGNDASNLEGAISPYIKSIQTGYTKKKRPPIWRGEKDTFDPNTKNECPRSSPKTEHSETWRALATDLQNYKPTCRHTYRPTDLQTDLPAYRPSTDRQQTVSRPPTDLQTYMKTDLQTYIPTYLQTYIPADLQTYIHTYIPTYLHIYRPTHFHTYIPTDL